MELRQNEGRKGRVAGVKEGLIDPLIARARSSYRRPRVDPRRGPSAGRAVSVRRSSVGSRPGIAEPRLGPANRTEMALASGPGATGPRGSARKRHAPARKADGHDPPAASGARSDPTVIAPYLVPRASRPTAIGERVGRRGRPMGRPGVATSAVPARLACVATPVVRPRLAPAPGHEAPPCAPRRNVSPWPSPPPCDRPDGPPREDLDVVSPSVAVAVQARPMARPCASVPPTRAKGRTGGLAPGVARLRRPAVEIRAPGAKRMGVPLRLGGRGPRIHHEAFTHRRTPPPVRTAIARSRL